MKTRRRLLAAALLVPALPAAARALTAPRHPLVGPRWIVARIDGVPPETDPTSGPPYLEFGLTDEFNAYNGCNHLNGTWTANGDRIAFGRWSSTKMACHGPRHQLEQAINGALRDVETWRLDGDTLTLAGKRARLTLLARPAPSR